MKLTPEEGNTHMNNEPTLLDMMLQELARTHSECQHTGYMDKAYGAMNFAGDLVRRLGGSASYNDRGRVYTLNGQTKLFDRNGIVSDI